MAWRDRLKSLRGAGRGSAAGRAPGSRRSDLPTATTEMRRPDPGRDLPGGYARSEEQVITDGQLGSHNLDRGPERANPEGSVDISNTDYRE